MTQTPDPIASAVGTSAKAVLQAAVDAAKAKLPADLAAFAPVLDQVVTLGASLAEDQVAALTAQLVAGNRDQAWQILLANATPEQATGAIADMLLTEWQSANAEAAAARAKVDAIMQAALTVLLQIGTKAALAALVV